MQSRPTAPSRILMALVIFATHHVVSAQPARPPAPPRPGPLVLTAPTVPGVATGVSAAPLSASAHASISEYLALDLNNLFSYARPSLPVHYDAAVTRADNTPPDNRITDPGATLGRVLFNDKRLSTTNTVACASCHQQASGFTDPARLSAGVAPGITTTAHSMRLGNISYYNPGSMFWDKRAASLEQQATQPILNANEMGFDASHGGITMLIAKMQTLPYYPALFQWVYGTPAITEARIQRALAQYERSMISAGSRWDSGYATVYNPQLPDKGLSLDVPGLTAQENHGRRLFLLPPQQGGEACGSCHRPPTFALGGNARGNGLDVGETTVFKSPSLKNVGVGKAFMHDGRFASLEQVVDHYDHGVKDGPALDNRLKGRNGLPRILNLTPVEKAALVAFMKTLTDTAFLADPRFSDPFKK